ncbi:hypothetical protein ABZW11_07520 [Nonomuraea sp. NPDC004580]|uniref:hypothetical protein n=1 Tax=Nonomuraea sp. NPDC004580 TaxID=3154552 RepID=UPI0033B22C93
MLKKIVTATSIAGLLATAVVLSGGTAAAAAVTSGVARQFPWEASIASPDGGHQPDGGYHND